MRYLIKIGYDGTNFYGFQRLNNLRTVQKELEDALTIINKKNVIIKGAGRTDRGVHAYGQMAHFDLDVNIPAERLVNAINSLIGEDIHIVDCQQVSADFHARFMVKKKEYVYRINLGVYDPLKNNYYWQIPYKLDMKKMEQAAKIFIGGHDFHNFVAGYRENYEAIIYDLKITKKNDILELKFIGKSFYRYMVRGLVGALVDVGKNKATLETIKEMLDEPSKPKQLSVAPPKGLYLMKIEY